MIAICDAEEGAPSQLLTIQKRSAGAVDMSPADLVLKRQRPAASDAKDDAFSQAIASGCVKSPKERPTICTFICLENPILPESERLRKLKNFRSLSRHFVNKHVKPFPNGIQCKCTICGKHLESKSALLNHAQSVYRTVSCLPLLVLGLPLSTKLMLLFNHD